MVTHLQAGLRPSRSIGGSDGFPGTDAGSAGTLLRVQDNHVGEGVESSAIGNAQPDRCGSGTHPTRGGSQSTDGGSPGIEDALASSREEKNRLRKQTAIPGGVQRCQHGGKKYPLKFPLLEADLAEDILFKSLRRRISETPCFSLQIGCPGIAGKQITKGSSAAPVPTAGAIVISSLPSLPCWSPPNLPSIPRNTPSMTGGGQGGAVGWPESPASRR